MPKGAGSGAPRLDRRSPCAHRGAGRGSARPRDLRGDVKAALERLKASTGPRSTPSSGGRRGLRSRARSALDDLIETIEAVEDVHGAADERFPHDRPDHPGRPRADPAPRVRDRGRRRRLRCRNRCAGAARRARSRREIPGLISIADSQPRVRRFLENRLGRPATDVTLVTANALSQALGQGPLGLVVDIAHRVGVVGELQARQRGVGAARAGARARAQQRAPARAGIRGRGRCRCRPGRSSATRTARRSVRSAAFAVALGVTRDPRRASDLSARRASRRPRRSGARAFAAQLDRGLAAHGVITMDPAALRRLDRVDALVLEARVASVRTRGRSTRSCRSAKTPTCVECTLRARRLFDPKDPTRHSAGGARGRSRRSPMRIRCPAARRARGRARSAPAAAACSGCGTATSSARSSPSLEEPAPLADELVEGRQAAGLEVFLAGGTDAFAHAAATSTQRLVVGPLARRAAGRCSARAGSRCSSPATIPRRSRVADVGLGVEVDGAPVPWGADLVVGSGLANAWRVVDAMRVRPRREPPERAARARRRVDRRHLGARGAGAAPRPARALLPINASALRLDRDGRHRRPGRRAIGRYRVPDRAIRGTRSTPTRRSLCSRAPPTGSTHANERRRRRRRTARVVAAPVGSSAPRSTSSPTRSRPLLALGAALSAAVGSTTDAALVSGVVGGNALVGAVQRVQTERSLRSLEERRARTVVACGSRAKCSELAADSLVVGDVIELAAGETVPADCRLLEAIALEVDESAITGESLPVYKTVEATPGAPVAERTSMLYDGSAIAAGRAVALVVAVGRDTEAGRSAAPRPRPAAVGRRATPRRAHPPDRAGDPRGRRHRHRARGSSTGARRATRSAPASRSRSRRCPKGSRRWRRSRRSRPRGGSRRATRSCATRARSRRSAASTRCASTRPARSRRARSRSSCVSDGDARRAPRRARATAAALCSPRRCARHRWLDGDDVLPHATDQAIVVGAAAAGVGDRDGVGAWDRIDEIPFESRRGYHAVLGDDGNGERVDHGEGRARGRPSARRHMATRRRRPSRSTPRTVARSRNTSSSSAGAGLRVLAVAEAPRGRRRRPRRRHRHRRPRARSVSSALADLVRPDRGRRGARSRGRGRARRDDHGRPPEHRRGDRRRARPAR